MTTIVITGSTRGIGYGLAEAFLSQGCAVVISGRTREAVDQAVATLAAKFDPVRIFGHPCDVTDFSQVQALWDTAHSHFGRIDIWINNAGLSHPQLNFWKLTSEQIKEVVSANLIGAMYGSKVALHGMLAQGSGALYNMEGLGSDGRQVTGMTLYGSTKYGLHYLNKALAVEALDKPVIVGIIRPGMVMTDLVTKQYEGKPEDWARVKGIFAIIASRVEDVTPWLAKKILANDKSGAQINYLTFGKLLLRFLLAPFRKRELK